MRCSSGARRIIATASASVFSPHQPVETVQVPKPTSLTLTSVLGKTRYFMAVKAGGNESGLCRPEPEFTPRAASGLRTTSTAEQPRRVQREIRDDHVGAGAADAEQALHHRAVAVDPSALGGRLNPNELATHLVRGQRVAGLLLHAGDDIQERTRRLDHHHVGALLDVEPYLAQRLARVGRVHLVPAPIPRLWRALRRLSEGAIQGAGEL